MKSATTVLPSRQNFAHRRADGDLTTLYAIELFIVVMILDAIFIALAAPVLPDAASLYGVVT